MSTAKQASAETIATSEESRIPSLDGLRAISIILVIVSHLALSGTFAPATYLWRFDIGNLGVRVFFVISGFLITTILLRELALRQRISLRKFYLRRAFRIAPAYYTFLALMFVCAAIGWATIPNSDFVSAIFYYSNYSKPAFAIAHSWSLSVEEQFYLLWPGLLAIAGLRRSTWVAFAILLTAPALRIAAELAPHWPTNPRYAFETVADALATGCLLAIYRERLWHLKWYQALLTSRYFAPVACVILASKGLQPNNLVWAGLGIPALNILIALSIDRYMRFPNTPVGRALNWKPITFIGVLSYSLYLWQQPFLHDQHPIIFPLNLLLIFACALASYYVVERPALTLRKKLEARSAKKKAAAVVVSARG